MPIIEDLSPGFQPAVEKPDEQKAIDIRRAVIEAAIVRIKGILRYEGSRSVGPTCFINYAWSEQGTGNG